MTLRNALSKTRQQQKGSPMKDDRDEKIITRIQEAENELTQKFNQISALLGCDGLTGTEAEEGAQHVADILGRWVGGDTAEGEGFAPELRQMLDQYSEIWSRCEAAKEELRSEEEEAREAKLHAARAQKVAALVQPKLEDGQTKGGVPMAEEAKKIDPPAERSEIKSKLLKETFPLTPPDPFDAKALRLPPEFTKSAGIRKVISTIPVRKPHGQEWIRVRADEGFSEEYGVIILKDDNEVYLLHPNLVGDYENEMTKVRIFVCLSMNKNLFLWAAKLPGSGNRNADSWNSSAIEAAEAAMKRKVRVQSNRALSAYEYAFSDSPTPENDPVWPDLTYSEILRIAFAKPGRFVDDHNHEVLRLLREG